MTAHAKNYFRPTLETLENREMMDAGIGGAVMHGMMLDIAQGAQVRLLAQEPSALQNQNNPLSQSLTQANQAFLAQSQQLNANVQAADRIFSAWSHHVDQVVQNIPGLQDVAGRIQASPFGELSQGDQQHQLKHDRPMVHSTESAEKYGRQLFDAFNQKFAQGSFANRWGILNAEFVSAKEVSRNGKQLDIKLTRVSFSGNVFHSTLSLKFSTFVSGYDARHVGDTWIQVDGSDVMTDGKSDGWLFLLQGALLGFTVRGKD